MDFFIRYDEFLVATATLMSLHLCFKSSIGWRAFIGVLAGAGIFMAIEPAYLLADILLPKGKNPQFITVGLMLLANIGLAGVLLFGRRSFDRILVLAMMTSVTVTAFLFHYILVYSILPAWGKDASWANQYLIEKPFEQFDAACQADGFKCWSGKALELNKIRPDLQGQLQGISDFYTAQGSNEPFAHALNAFNDISSNGVAVALFYHDADGYRLVVDEKAGKRIHGLIRSQFYLLCSIAHAVWLFGCLFLIAFHKRRFGHRLKIGSREMFQSQSSGLATRG